MPVEVLRPDSCVHCGRVMNDYNGGHGGYNGLPLCHPNAPNRPDCYHMVTVYHHQLLDCARCRQEPWQPLTATEHHDAMLDALRRLEAMITDVIP